MSNKIETIWLKNIKNGLIFLIAKEDRFLYSELLFVDATKSEIEAWQNGTYWNQEPKKDSK